MDEMTTYKTLMKVKVNCSAYPDELPPKLIREYAPLIAKPLSVLINLCFRIGIFPAVCKKAYIRVIRKVTNPKSCDELRPISQTPCLAKVAETFIMRVLLDQIQGSINQRQYGGLKDCNTSVYLVRMYDSLLKWVEKGHSFVDLGAIDFRKAFDLINHIVAALNLKLMGANKRLLRSCWTFSVRGCIVCLLSTKVTPIPNGPHPPVEPLRALSLQLLYSCL
ncbi:uncharacterized protein LOC136034700 [Artemia franciscana]|uniref:uncharacterized protein LOC136034700 n=1 Tax=Artemia franciscana TaxID=6661 RepID=UPI0032DA0B89